MVEGYHLSERARIRLIEKKRQEANQRELELDAIVRKENCLKAMRFKQMFQTTYYDQRKDWVVASVLSPK